ncbi:hypothetical protein EVAR_22816_1 [Eumeta japonica]|uniref:Uncharacterized protein n=1 Tax=Eumeta variegata TaxID=151549 RepID=A0A4C1VHX9_EUMVA|nr:hypothetical protein EVAR_22816_1 [Eumeta japonica]
MLPGHVRGEHLQICYGVGEEGKEEKDTTSYQLITCSYDTTQEHAVATPRRYVTPKRNKIKRSSDTSARRRPCRRFVFFYRQKESINLRYRGIAGRDYLRRPLTRFT